MIRRGDLDYCIACASYIPAHAKHNNCKGVKPMNPIEKKRKQAVGRKRAFVDAIASETYGKCPRPPCGGGSLKNMIDSFVSVRAGSVLVRCLDQWNKAEIEYALKVCKALGFKATWV